jgi:hypothetical protein
MPQLPDRVKLGDRQKTCCRRAFKGSSSWRTYRRHDSFLAGHAISDITPAVGDAAEFRAQILHFRAAVREGRLRAQVFVARQLVGCWMVCPARDPPIKRSGGGSTRL